jgi:PAS domain S-box-containing protein
MEEPCEMTSARQAGLHSAAEAEAQWQELFEHSPLMYFTVDPAGTVLAVNTFGAAQLGYTAGELVGQSVLNVFLPEDKAAARKHLDLCVQNTGQRNKWEIRKVRKDGTLVWVRENAKALRRSDGDLIVLIACEDINDRKRGEQRLRAQYGVTRGLAESASLAAASSALLRTICEAMDWDWGALWTADQQAEALRCDSIWHVPAIDLTEFDVASRQFACRAGEGRAGQVWQTCQPLWIVDVARDPGFRRGPAAAKTGLHTGVACPILLGNEALGIIEFYSRRIRQPDEQELAVLSAIGSQIGQFIRRKRAEQALRDSEERFRTLVQFSFDVYWESDAQHRYTRQEFAERLFDPPAPGSEIGKTRWEVPYLEPDEEAWRKHRATLDAHLPFRDFEFARPMPDGGRRYISTSGLPVFDDAGRFVGYRGVGRHITERKRAESLTAQFFESSPDGVCIVERDYRYRRANPVYARRWGVSAEIVGMHVCDVLGVDRFERTLKPNLDRCFAGEEVTFDWSSATSPRRYFAVSYSPLRMGSEEVEAVLVIQRDVTDRKETELALRDSEQRFRDYAETASDWLWESDAEHRFTLFSRSLSWGYAREFVGTRRWDVAGDLDEEPEKWRAHIVTMEAHEPFRGFRYRAVRPDGSSIYVSVSGKPVFDVDGKFVGYRGVASDVSAEQALLEAQTELAHVARVTTLGELTASIAHEVNQPLAAVVTNAGASLRLLDVPDLAEAREALSCIISDANRAADVIARIRALTKKTPFQKQQVDLNAVVREVAGLTRNEMDRNGVELRMQLAEDLPPVQADRIELQQLVLNLIVNAIDAMSDGARRDLSIFSATDGATHVQVSVCDSGRGLDPAAADRIFQPFYTTKPGGMGMGLAICRSILERLGGQLSARANAPYGTIFEVRIPIEQTEASAEPTQPATG